MSDSIRARFSDDLELVTHVPIEAGGFTVTEVEGYPAADEEEAAYDNTTDYAPYQFEHTAGKIYTVSKQDIDEFYNKIEVMIYMADETITLQPSGGADPADGYGAVTIKITGDALENPLTIHGLLFAGGR